MVPDDRLAISILIPTLNEAGTIAEVLYSIPPQYVGAVLVVDGGSDDGTVEIVRNLGFRVIRQDGHGLGRAIATGVRETTGDIIVTLDGDGAHNGTHVLQLLDKLDEGYDLVVASRMTQAPEDVGMFSRRRRSTEPRGVVRDAGNRLFTALCRVMFGVRIRDVLNGCKAFRRPVFLSAQLQRPGQEHDVELLLKTQLAGFRIAEVAIQQGPRQAGVSKLSVLRHGVTILRVIADEFIRSRHRPPGGARVGSSMIPTIDSRSRARDAPPWGS
jgi:glycosyltransferase involved in cell wall biosynthesis